MLVKGCTSLPVSFPPACVPSGYRLTEDKYSPSAAPSVFSPLPAAPSNLPFSSSPTHAAVLPSSLKQNEQSTPIFSLWLNIILCPAGQTRLPFVCFAMETVGLVEFRNVGCSYFPESRVDCHYTLSSQHSWASSDWIGLFKVSLPCRLPQKKSTRALLERGKPPPKKPQNSPGVTVFPSSGGLVVGEGLPHVCLGAGPGRLRGGH